MKLFNRNRDGDPSKRLEEGLSRIVKTHEEVEKQFRSNHVRDWTVMFCDVSRTLRQKSDDENLQDLILTYRALVEAVIERFDTPFILPGNGPLVLVCFRTPQAAAAAAARIQKGMEIWRLCKGETSRFVPTIGLHTGEFVVRNNELMQSHDCNLGKRIETEAAPGQIALSSSTREALSENDHIIYLRTATVKNIPEPQQIFVFDWSNIPAPDIDYRALGMEVDSSGGVNPMLEDAEDERFLTMIVMDIAGSSKKFWNLGDREGNMLIDFYQQQVVPVLKKFKAVHIEPGEGDQIVACFDADKTVETVLAAIEIQRCFFRYNSHSKTRGNRKIEISTGVHIGGVVIRNGRVAPTHDFFVCKGIQETAEANEILLSDQMAAFVGRAPNVTLKEIGPIGIKGSSDPVTVHEIEWFRSGRKENKPGFPDRSGTR